ncbi:hypothetical protein SCBWM1_gp110 [Synechococcus phage S-CBWM1]|uniref:Uncharacterized protein n=1 Tax=Synechococcus phage S-CBWM1 TaxID=2053653 RepID=A0A3G1L3N1_9CAUD|nr:hypothetical protein HOU61_gp087 [Synechococcus phage S-CBWM1]ATW62794.1 hypothetical protein SCBWM1_gp110 [Synechococcus phage S-CBWM1]
MNLNLADDLFIIVAISFIRTMIDKVFWEPIAILVGKKVSVELLAKGYEALDLIMFDLLRDYSGPELRHQIRTRLEKATGTKWDDPMVNEFRDKFNYEIAAAKVAETKLKLSGTDCGQL